MKYNTYQREEKGYRNLYPLTLTNNQQQVIEEYCLEQSYMLSIESIDGKPYKYPCICKDNCRLPLQLIDGKIMAVNGPQLIDVYQLAYNTRMVNHYLSRNGNVKRQFRFKFANSNLRDNIIKGLGIEKLEI